MERKNAKPRHYFVSFFNLMSCFKTANLVTVCILAQKTHGNLWPF